MGYKHDDACLASVADNEPIFVLRAQDKLAPILVRLWATLCEPLSTPDGKLEEAYILAVRMEEWQRMHGSKWPD